MRKLQSAFDKNRTPLNALNEIYAVILRGALPVNSDSKTVERFQAVIGTIIIDPLPIPALTKLIRLNPEDVYAVLDNLQPVISFGSDGLTPRIRHKSFSNYITDPMRCKDRDLCIVPEDHLTRIATLKDIQPRQEDFSHNFGRITLGLVAIVALGLAWPT
jgi:hypothetical protein